MQAIFNRHLFISLGYAILFITLALVGTIMLVQSLQFLELILETGAPTQAFFSLIGLALPRFLETILPIATFAGVVFIYNKVSGDSELIIMRSAGCSPRYLMRPALFMGVIIGLFIFVLSGWLTPNSLNKMKTLRNVVKTEYSNLLFREETFTTIRGGITIYVKEKNKDGSLSGLVIYDGRATDTPPNLITAKKGVLLQEADAQKIIIYDGIQQRYDPIRKTLSSLSFDQYNLTIPIKIDALSQRWQEPNERRFDQLFTRNLSDQKDIKFSREFVAEIHRRISLPLLTIAFALIGGAAFLFGSINRRGYGRQIAVATGAVIILQSLFLISFNIAKDTGLGIILMYGLSLTPIILITILSTPLLEKITKTPFKKRRSNV